MSTSEDTNHLSWARQRESRGTSCRYDDIALAALLYDLVDSAADRGTGWRSGY